jgi:cytochrome P450
MARQCETVTIVGVTVPLGSLVLAAITSANRDERQFTKSNRLDITREPNKHLFYLDLGRTTAWAHRSPALRDRSRSAR